MSEHAFSWQMHLMSVHARIEHGIRFFFVPNRMLPEIMHLKYSFDEVRVWVPVNSS